VKFLALWVYIHGGMRFPKLQNCRVAKALMSWYVLCKNVEFFKFNTSSSDSLRQSIVLCHFNFQNWYFCSSVTNWFTYANEANIGNKDSPIRTSTDQSFLARFTAWTFCKLSRSAHTRGGDVHTSLVVCNLVPRFSRRGEVRDPGNKVASCAGIRRVLEGQFARALHARQWRLRSFCPCLMTHEFKTAEFHATSRGDKTSCPQQNIFAKTGMSQEENCRCITFSLGFTVLDWKPLYVMITRAYLIGFMSSSWFEWCNMVYRPIIRAGRVKLRRRSVILSYMRNEISLQGQCSNFHEVYSRKIKQ